MKNISLKNDNGFTLLEVLISLVIISIGLLGIGGLFTSQIRSNSVSKKNTIANSIALDIIEEVKNVPFYALRNANNSAPCQIASGNPALAAIVDCLRPNNGNAQYDFFNSDAAWVNINTLSDYAGTNFSMEIKRIIAITAEQVDGSGDITLKNISVQVDWKDTMNNIHSLSYQTLKDRGIQ